MKGFNTDLGKECVCFMGPTGSGKSTLLNYILAKQNLLKFKKEAGAYKIDSLGESSPMIGNDKRSCTKFPTNYPDPEK